MEHREREMIGCCGRMKQAGEVPFARPGSKPSYAPDHDFNVCHILLDVAVDFKKKSLSGTCTTTLEAVNSGVRTAVFDAVGMKVLSVKNDSGRKLSFTYKNKKISVKLPKASREGEKISLSIQYLTQRPPAGIYFTGPDKFYPKKPVQMWTHGEAEESRYWFPCIDAPHHKATTEMIATVPKDFFALSNGGLIGTRENKKERTRTYHWLQNLPHSCYLITLVAGKFSEIRDEWDGIPILYYCTPGREAEAKRAFGKTPKMVKFFSEYTGFRYPYEKYAQIAVADFIMGGMEHTTATTQTDVVLMDARAYPEFTADWLVSHELAHQWFGDLVTCKEWSHAWLNESFATYCEMLFIENDLGKDEADWDIRGKLETYLEEEKKSYSRPIVTNVYRKPEDLFDRHLYEKGSVVLHMLRRKIGDRLFQKAVQNYVRTAQNKAVETNDLVNAIQEATGKNLRRFFDQWIFGAGHPDFRVHTWWDEAKKTANVRIIQTPQGGKSLFSVPVKLEFLTADGVKTFKENIDGKKHEFSYKFKKEPLDLRFDPEYSLLKTASIFKPYKMWVKQIETDTHACGRADAAKEIGKTATEESVKVLARAFRKEKFWGTAKQIALALGNTRLESARAFLIDALKVKHPKIRRGVAEALGNFSDPKTFSKLAQVFRKDSSYFVAAEAFRSAERMNLPEGGKLIRAALKRDSWNEVIRGAALSSLTRNPDAGSMALVKKFARAGEPLPLRLRAVQTLCSHSNRFPELLNAVSPLVNDPLLRVQNASIEGLGETRSPRAIAALKGVLKDKDLPFRKKALAEDALLKISPAKDEPA